MLQIWLLLALLNLDGALCCFKCKPALLCAPPIRLPVLYLRSCRSRYIDSTGPSSLARIGRSLSIEDEGSSENPPNSALKQFMLSSIQWYRRELSPIMPPNCRFFPSCSNYALQAIEEYGALRGGVLTAWRILRCNPLGGYGYDPPQWPPPGFFAGTGGKR
jgi:putative membrane protein insertion efficiency factor